MLIFYVERYKALLFNVSYLKKQPKKFHNFGRNHGLTPLEKCQFCGFLKSMFYSLEMLVFYVGTYQTLSLGLS